MKVSDIMIRTIQTVASYDTVQEAALRMKKSDVGMLPVLNSGHLVGIVTDRDLVIRAMSEGKLDTLVEDVMSPHLVKIPFEADIDQAIETMENRRIGRLVVENDTGDLVGVITANDIAIACAGDQRVGELAASLAKAHRHTDLPVAS